MKKRAIALALSAVMLTGLVGCGKKSDGAKGGTVKVGMVTDSGTIDDKSFNQGTWEGIKKAESDLGIKGSYQKPTGSTEADLTKEIVNLHDAGNKIIVTPGFKFSTAIFNAQDKYKDTKFVIIDASPDNGKTGADKVEKVADNTVSIFFAEQQAGFLAGVAASLQLKTGDFGFIGGMEIPAVQRYNWGFQQGVKYANESLGTKITIKAENVIYQGTFSDVAAGQQLAATMYDRGVKAVFTAAGAVGVGAINEAKTRATAGKEAWVIGVDSDQYADGKYADGKSIILTSAMKKVDQATYDMIKDDKDGKFQGGKTLTFDAKNDGVGIPAENPNLDKDTTDKVKSIFEDIKSDKIKVSAEKGDLIK